jgi:uncharacterized protein YndB with AHSA1/START domain
MVTANKVGLTTFTTPSDREIVMTRVFDAPRAVVFEAWTTPEHLRRWLLGPEGWTMTICDIDFRPGGAWHYAWHNANGTDMHIHGTYREIVVPERIVTTEAWGDPWPDTVNTLTLTESGSRTTVTNQVVYPSKEARDAALTSGMQHGVEASYARLDEHLQTLG